MYETSANHSVEQVIFSNFENNYVTNPLQNPLKQLDSWDIRKLLKDNIRSKWRELTPSTLSIGLHIIDICDNKTFITHYGVKKIAEQTHVSVRTVERALAQLRKKGFLQTRQKSKYFGRWQTNQTTLNLLHVTVRHQMADSLLLKGEKQSINTKDENTIFANKEVEEKTSASEKPNNSKEFELTLDWSASMQTIKNLEKLGLTYETRESERRSWVLYTLKQAGGKRILTKQQANAMYYHFCRTTLEREKQFTEKGKRFMPMELRRNLAEQKLYTQPEPALPAPDIPVYNRINESQAMQLKNILASKKAFKAPAMIPWKLQAYKELTKKPDDDLLEAEFQRQKNEGLI